MKNVSEQSMWRQNFRYGLAWLNNEAINVKLQIANYITLFSVTEQEAYWMMDVMTTMIWRDWVLVMVA
jgi:hypothetical protein